MRTTHAIGIVVISHWLYSVFKWRWENRFLCLLSPKKGYKIEVILNRRHKEELWPFEMEKRPKNGFHFLEFDCFWVCGMWFGVVLPRKLCILGCSGAFSACLHNQQNSHASGFEILVVCECICGFWRIFHHQKSVKALRENTHTHM